MKNEERRQQTIRKLLDATKELLQDKSCHVVTLKDIMDKTELSKGAIFHYVKSKDEIFTWILQERLEEINQRFMKEVEQSGSRFDEPMQAISNSLRTLEDPQEVTNKILMYLLGKEEDPLIAEALRGFKDRSVQLAKQWIMTGQQHGVIRPSIDADQTSELFVLLSFGLRVGSTICSAPASFGSGELSSFMAKMLKNESLKN
ncbi:TetR family transcriptional regulator [Paenibacillus yonginensis]|uniref:TetR family transcriptional regulator n=1 Tax=Paenibacillus yonginensis TaxID=1462996 RepID=A0A1B1MX61_9BACL|nr:TetR/AcrR family transcriptional regulator [Paenibacillus yonginensis]ANS73772.1 TetR family transcriptional regulator [Paenibacillus yonginensis]